MIRPDGIRGRRGFALLLALSAALLLLAACREDPPAADPVPDNGQRIYMTGTSSRDEIVADTGTRGPGMGMGMMMGGGGRIACADCHGADGKGEEVRMMMRTFTAPDIRYSTLTGSDPDMEHPPYTDRTIKRAITDGVDPAGHELDPTMPRWRMSDQDLDDVIAYLKKLD